MSLLKSKKVNGDYEIRFKLDGRTIIVVGRTLTEALKKVNMYHPIYL